MRPAVLSIVAAGCTAQPLDLDILVAPSFVRVYANGTDGTTGLNLPADTFPTGGCVGEAEDISSQPTSCIDRLVISDGATQLVDATPSPGASYLADMTTATAPELEISGCGGDAHVPLGTTPFVAPTATVTSGNGEASVAWSGPPAVVVNFYGGLGGGERCHVTSSPVTHPHRANEFLSVDVFALDEPTIVNTEFGPARVWRGGFVFEMVTP